MKKFPAKHYKLTFENINGIKKHIYFEKLICRHTKPKSIAIIKKNILNEVKGLDKLCEVLYIRDEKNWKKYNNKTFRHTFNGNELVYGFKDNKNKIVIKSDSDLWGNKKIDKKDL